MSIEQMGYQPVGQPNRQRVFKKTTAQNAILEMCDKIGKVNGWSRVLIREERGFSK
ncbi:MAG: hypothetical protein ACXAB7_15575 [Candidatus Kariarchaeaceae archaeon]